MEPERHSSYTHVERDRETRSGSGMAFIVGGLVVAVAVIALIVWGAPFGTDIDDADVEISTQTQVPGAEPSGPAIENNIEVKPEPVESTPAPAPTESAPAAPAQN